MEFVRRGPILINVGNVLFLPTHNCFRPTDMYYVNKVQLIRWSHKLIWCKWYQTTIRRHVVGAISFSDICKIISQKNLRINEIQMAIRNRIITETLVYLHRSAARLLQYCCSFSSVQYFAGCWLRAGFYSWNPECLPNNHQGCLFWWWLAGVGDWGLYLLN